MMTQSVTQFNSRQKLFSPQELKIPTNRLVIIISFILYLLRENTTKFNLKLNSAIINESTGCTAAVYTDTTVCSDNAPSSRISLCWGQNTARLRSAPYNFQNLSGSVQILIFLSKLNLIHLKTGWRGNLRTFMSVQGLKWLSFPNAQWQLLAVKINWQEEVF